MRILTLIWENTSIHNNRIAIIDSIYIYIYMSMHASHIYASIYPRIYSYMCMHISTYEYHVFVNICEYIRAIGYKSLCLRIYAYTLA